MHTGDSQRWLSCRKKGDMLVTILCILVVQRYLSVYLTTFKLHGGCSGPSLALALNSGPSPALALNTVDPH